MRKPSTLLLAFLPYYRWVPQLSRLRSRIPPRISLAAALLLCVVLRPVEAAAHAILLGSEPAANAVILASTVPVHLEFNSRIDASRSTLILAGPTATTRLPLTHQDRPNLLTATIKALPPGTYLLRWQVLATDGHITRGEIPFTIR